MLGGLARKPATVGALAVARLPAAQRMPLERLVAEGVPLQQRLPLHQPPRQPAGVGAKGGGGFAWIPALTPSGPACKSAAGVCGTSLATSMVVFNN